MKLLPALLFIVTIVAASSCRKGKSNLYPPKLQYVLLSDVSNGHKLTGTKINLLSCLTDIGPGGICVEGPVIGMPITDTDGMIKFTDSRVTGFDCAVPGFFPLHRFITGQIDYDGLTYDVKLLPEAFLDIQLSPQTTYPAGYKFYMEWTCGAPLNFINTDGILQPDDNNPVESILIFRMKSGGSSKMIIMK